MLIEYPKIYNLFQRNNENKKLEIGSFALKEFEYLQNNQWDFTEKLDGTNVRVYWDDEKKQVFIYGRTKTNPLPKHAEEAIRELFNAKELEIHFPTTKVLFFGECIGKKIQEPMGSKYNKDGVDFVLFDVRINNTWLTRESVNGLAKSFGLKFSPVISQGTIHQAVNMVQKGITSYFGDLKAEGLVIRPSIELYGNKRFNRVIAKLKCKDYQYE